MDGPVHEAQGDYAAGRTRILEPYGLTVIRFSNYQVLTDLAGVLRKIRRQC